MQMFNLFNNKTNSNRNLENNSKDLDNFYNNNIKATPKYNNPFSMFSNNSFNQRQTQNRNEQIQNLHFEQANSHTQQNNNQLNYLNPQNPFARRQLMNMQQQNMQTQNHNSCRQQNMQTQHQNMFSEQITPPRQNNLMFNRQTQVTPDNNLNMFQTPKQNNAPRQNIMPNQQQHISPNQNITPNQQKNIVPRQNQNYQDDPNITFEPIDPALLSQIKGFSGQQIKPQSLEKITPEVKTINVKDQPKLQPVEQMKSKTVDAQYLSSLSNFIQGGKNAASFYSYLSRISKNHNHRNFFAELSMENENRNQRLGQIYSNLSGQSFIPTSASNKFSHDIKNGIISAIKEECKSVKEFSDFFEKTDDETNSRYLNSIMYKKMSDVGIMNLMLLEL